MNRFPRAGWHNVARRPLFWSDTVDDEIMKDRRIMELSDYCETLKERLDAVTHLVETLLLISPLAHVGGPDRPIDQWRRIARGQ